jgi:hypothetical protein
MTECPPHNVLGPNKGGVCSCECKTVCYATCSNCSRIVKQNIFPSHFTLSESYDLKCHLCKDLYCPDCANVHLTTSGTQSCYKCRSTENRAYNDEAAYGWAVTYHCCYIDRNSRTCNNVFLHPTLFGNRTAALEKCVDYLTVALSSLVEDELITRTCEELDRKIQMPEVQDLLDQIPGFQIKCTMATPAGPSLAVLVVGKTLRSQMQKPFE